MNDLSAVPRYHVYRYEHLDDLSFLRDPDEVLNSEIGWALHGKADTTAWVAEIGTLLKSHGWEGDGDIRIMWLPPFLPVGTEDTMGTYVWVVKQDNNGTAFMASEHPLKFPRLLDQNR